MKTKTAKTSMSKTKMGTSRSPSKMSGLAKVTSTESKGTGKYAKRSSTPLTNRQAYKLEKQSLKNEREAMATKPQIIKAAGQAFAMNVAPTASSYAASAGVAKGLSQQTNDLINGGMKQSGTSNEEEMDEASGNIPGGFIPN